MLSYLRQTRPAPAGPHAIGCLRTRMPMDDKDMQVQLHYPAEGEELLTNEAVPLFRPQVLENIGDSKGIPQWALRSLFYGAMQADPPLAPSTASKWPVVFFSSGIFGSCEMYTQFCRDLASFGMIVISMEHEDGSGVYAVNFAGEPVPYVDPPEGSNVVEFRAPNLKKRGEEISALVRTVRKGGDGSLWGKVLQQGDADRMALVGHSLGAAGALRYLRTLSENGEPCPFTAAVFLDMWPEPLVEADLAFAPQLDFAVILSEEWTNSSFLKDNQRLISNASNRSKCIGMRCPGTSHQWISETQMIMPFFVLRRTGLMGSGDWFRCYAAVAAGSGEFLAGCFGIKVRQDLEKLDPEVFQKIDLSEQNVK